MAGPAIPLTAGFGGFVHDGNYCVLDSDGHPSFVGEEERFCRIKRQGGFPASAFAYVSQKNSREPRMAHAVALSRQTLSHGLVWNPYQEAFPNAEFTRINHHLAHAGGTFYSSPYRDAAILTIDGLGDDLCSILAVGRDSRIEVLNSVHYLHSLGVLWMRTGWFLGFTQDHFFSGAKVMALAAYGTPKYAETFLQLFDLHSDGTYEINPGKFRIESIARFWEKEEPFFLGKSLGISPRKPGARILKIHKDIAASMQRASEEVVLHIARCLHRRTGMRNLCLAGGVALNCTQNGRLLREGPFERLFVVPNASDSGDGMGAALYHHHHNLGAPRSWSMGMPYLGAGYSKRDMESALSEARVLFSTPADISVTAAKAIARGAVIGWFQGRAEVGPRALGNRSILADPRGKNIRDYINREIKHRELFRPFAPSVLAEMASTWFECQGNLSYMLFAVPTRPERCAAIPGVLHVDMTARVQTVRATDNPLFRRLIEAFHEETGIPMVLNTSFNDRGEPIVNSPTDALRRFQESKLDALALGPFWIEKKGRSAREISR